MILLCLPSRWNGLQVVVDMADCVAALKLAGVVDGETLSALRAADQRAEVDLTDRCDFVPEQEDALRLSGIDIE